MKPSLYYFMRYCTGGLLYLSKFWGSDHLAGSSDCWEYVCVLIWLIDGCAGTCQITAAEIFRALRGVRLL